jgi:hypothetical protein
VRGISDVDNYSNLFRRRSKTLKGEENGEPRGAKGNEATNLQMARNGIKQHPIYNGLNVHRDLFWFTDRISTRFGMTPRKH